MEFPQKIGCVLMAAGSARRFGSNKLSVQLEGVTLAEHSVKRDPIRGILPSSGGDEIPRNCGNG